MLINVNMNKVQEAQLREIFKRQKRVWTNQEVKKYCYMWKDGGQFSTEKYLIEKDSDNKIS